MPTIDPKKQDALFQGLVEQLLARLTGGMCAHCGRSAATHQELQVIRQFLNDNGLVATAAPGSGMEALTKKLPFKQGMRLLEGEG